MNPLNPAGDIAVALLARAEKAEARVAELESKARESVPAWERDSYQQNATRWESMCMDAEAHVVELEAAITRAQDYLCSKPGQENDSALGALLRVLPRVPSVSEDKEHDDDQGRGALGAGHRKGLDTRGQALQDDDRAVQDLASDGGPLDQGHRGDDSRGADGARGQGHVARVASPDVAQRPSEACPNCGNARSPKLPSGMCTDMGSCLERARQQRTNEAKRVPKGKNGQVPGPVKPDGTWGWIDPQCTDKAVPVSPDRLLRDVTRAEDWAAVHIAGHKRGDSIINPLADLIAETRSESARSETPLLACADGRQFPEGHDIEECPPCLRAMRDGIRKEYEANVNIDLVKRLREMDRRIHQQRKELADLNARMKGPQAVPFARNAFDQWCMPLDRMDRRFASVCFRAGWQAARRAMRLPEDSSDGRID